MPFHKAIVSIIGYATAGELAMIAHIIKATKIPADHDLIAEAWHTIRDKELICCGHGNDFGVIQYLNDQKRQSENSTQAKKNPDTVEMKATFIFHDDTHTKIDGVIFTSQDQVGKKLIDDLMSGAVIGLPYSKSTCVYPHAGGAGQYFVLFSEKSRT